MSPHARSGASPEVETRCPQCGLRVRVSEFQTWIADSSLCEFGHEPIACPKMRATVKEARHFVRQD
jgi:hypothetical protein